MCHTITTKSVHCDNASHSTVQDVPCEKTLLKTLKSASLDAWTKLIKCSQKNRPIISLVAEECQGCKNAPSKPPNDPWDWSQDESLGWADIKNDDRTTETLEEEDEDDISRCAGDPMALDREYDDKMQSSDAFEDDRAFTTEVEADTDSGDLSS
ncbi:hypothetical protein H2198_005369 [Neophaeococcomyces mojaviensis]|uniref:Uncharacterized protein n=1 Tax=Neophaeococcomyces mojaviensis TaxID=3383035 RepID=A0ACC3A5Z7_9EURO|nr:hypothetical protein H2198_005369 [Knufia sp. JES_112]